MKSKIGETQSPMGFFEKKQTYPFSRLDQAFVMRLLQRAQNESEQCYSAVIRRFQLLSSTEQDALKRLYRRYYQPNNAEFFMDLLIQATIQNLSFVVLDTFAHEALSSSGAIKHCGLNAVANEYPLPLCF